MIKLFAVSLVLWGCAHTSDKFMQIKVGMDQATVQQILGAPENRALSHQKENWSYSYFDWKEGNVVKIVEFENGKVVSLHDDEVAKQRQHELQKAKAGAPQIQLGPNQRRCDQSNSYGRFPTGGGCNAYGCWPQGGSCSILGCSLTGECTAFYCPDKVTRFECSN